MKFMSMNVKQYVRLSVSGKILMTAIFLLGIVLGCCKKEVEVMPGLRWEYYSDRYSRLIWDEFGVIAEGRFDFIFCDYGLCVSRPGRDDSQYLDLIRGRVVKLSEAGTNLWGVVGVVFSIDAPTAMGVYDGSGTRSFEQASSNLNERLRRHPEGNKAMPVLSGVSLR